jgi:hypothetical protein
MPKRVTRNWLSRVAGGLTSGALALSLLSAGASSAPGTGVRPVLAEEIDCYNDKDLYSLPECVERRDLDRKSGNAQSEAQGAPIFGPEPRSGGGQQSSGGQQQSGDGGSEQQAGGSGQQGSGGSQQQAGGGQQQAAQGGDDDEEDPKPVPRGPVTDPRTVALTIADAGKEATQYLNDEGSDKYGKYVRTRYERDRSNGASALGPNVMDSKVWVAKDAETAKGLFKEQAAIKNFPERKEPAQGSVEKIKPTKYGEEFSYESAFYQDGDDKVWQHYRFVMRVGNVVSVVYLFGREEFFQDQKDRTWTGQGDWFTSAVFHRM